MLSTLFGLAVAVLTLAALALRVRGRMSARPRADDAQLLRVPGQVISQHPFTLRWTIRYPLPDGSANEFLVERTLPEHLREGMAVSVLVDPADPRRARLDMPGRSQFIKVILITVAVLVGVPLVIAGIVALTLSLR